jgi:carbon-monoxide dehydrogenase small subunit
MPRITITINGAPVTAEIDQRMLLIEFIREVAGLTGTHNGCMEARCGCCAVELNGMIVKSCNVLALQAAGGAVSTVEGLTPRRANPVEHITTQTLAGVFKPVDAMGADPKNFHPLQEAFHRRHALQCGFCTPGMVMSAIDLVQSHPEGLTEQEIREGLEGNLCRCTGYHNIVKAIAAAWPLMHGKELPAAAE